MTALDVPVREPAGQCRTCKAPILWGFTRKGMRVPVDPQPVLGGNLQLDSTDSGLVVIYVQADPDVVRHVSHFATCPDAAEHRRNPPQRRTR